MLYALPNVDIFLPGREATFETQALKLSLRGREHVEGGTCSCKLITTVSSLRPPFSPSHYLARADLLAPFFKTATQCRQVLVLEHCSYNIALLVFCRLASSLLAFCHRSVTIRSHFKFCIQGISLLKRIPGLKYAVTFTHSSSSLCQSFTLTQAELAFRQAEVGGGRKVALRRRVEPFRPLCVSFPDHHAPECFRM